MCMPLPFGFRWVAAGEGSSVSPERVWPLLEKHLHKKNTPLEVFVEVLVAGCQRIMLFC